MLLVYFLLLACHYASSCPPAESIAPNCICHMIGGDSMMVCNNVYNPDDLIAPIKAIHQYERKMYSISIMNSTLMYIPSEIFKGTTFEKVRFVHSEIMSLSDGDLAFVGLEDYMTELRATDARFTAQWDWNQLRNLRKMTLIDVHWIAMGSVPEQFPEFPELTALGIIRAEIEYIDPHAFSKLPKLTILILKENRIKDLKRSMIPDPADSLAIIDLSHNKLAELPQDFFTNMPNLVNLYLDGNLFTTLQENVFAWPLRNLQELTLIGNEIRCDCRMRWLAGGRTPFVFRATCAAPESLFGWDVASLKLKDLWC